jgi:hypothetical protein
VLRMIALDDHCIGRTPVNGELLRHPVATHRRKMCRTSSQNMAQ